MTVAAAVAVVAPAGREGKHGSYVDTDEKSHRPETIAAVAAAAAACHHLETSVAAAAAAAVACHRREANVAAAAAAVACHRHGASVAATAAAAEACHRRPRPPRPENHGQRQEHGGTEVPPTHTSPAIVSQFRGPCVESRRNGWCFLVSGGSVGGRRKSLFSRYRNVPELAENDLNNIRFAFLDLDSMHRCLEAGNAGK